MVRIGAASRIVPCPPTSLSFGVPAPSTPWHAKHFASYTTLPVAAVPEPAGSVAPSGPTLSSQAATCSAVAGTPRFGPGCAPANTSHAPPNATVVTRLSLRIDVAHFAGRRDVPALNGVVVVAELRAARCHQRGARRLHEAGLVDGSALQH